jgi:hypothetical protein
LTRRGPGFGLRVLRRQLIVGQATIMELSPLLVHASLSALPLGLLGGDPGLAFGQLGLPLPVAGDLAMGRGGLAAALLELALLASEPSLFSHPWQQDQQRDEDHHNNDDQDNQSGRHRFIPP